MAATPVEERSVDLGAEDGEAWSEASCAYRPGEPVRILVRRRDGRFDISDGAAALRLAGRPGDWLPTMEQVAAEHGMNVNRRGVLFVTGFRGRDLDPLVAKLAECSRAAYMALLDLGDE